MPDPSHPATGTPACRVHAHLQRIAPVRPTDYSDYGGDIERWAEDRAYPDCSGGCRWAIWIDADWLVCGRPDGPRQGMLTFEHQAGATCFEAGREGEPDIVVDGTLTFASDGASTP